MNYYRFLFAAFASLSFLLLGCETVTQTVYLQNVQVNGQLNQPPINITNGQKAGSITISPKIFFNSTKHVNAYAHDHTNVNKNGIYQVDSVYNTNGTWNYQESKANTYEFEGKNFNWNLPGISSGLQVNAALSNHFAVTCGFNFAIQDERKSFDGSLGIGFFSQNESSAFRFDLGLMWQSFYYDVSSVMVTTRSSGYNSKTTEVDFFRDKGKSSTINFYGALTFNSVNENSVFNYFVSMALFGQSLLDYTPQSVIDYHFETADFQQDVDKKIGTTFFSLTPGISFSLNKSSRLNFGINFSQELELEKASRSLFILPVVQFDMMF